MPCLETIGSALNLLEMFNFAAMSKTLVKYVILSLLLLVFALPAIQKELGFMQLKPLGGDVNLKKAPTPTWDNWFEGKLQQQFEGYIEDHIGFRNFFVRLHNQLDYSLFGEIHANKVIEGKEGYLFERGYVEAYLGLSFIGREVIDERMDKLEFLQQKWEASGKELIVVFAPGKGTFFPEYLPEAYDTIQKSMSNYDYYLQQCQERGIRHIDFNKWFVAMKDTSRYPLYPKNGIHWSEYGMVLAVDSLIHYVEALKGIDMPDFSWWGMEMSDTARSVDNDIEEGMNLLFRKEAYPLAYPKLKYENDSTKAQPGLFVVGDSYFYQVQRLGAMTRVFGSSDFWFYNQTIDRTDDWPIKPNMVCLPEEVEDKDIIVLLATDATLYKFAYGFIDRAYGDYKTVDDIEQRLLGDSAWVATVRADSVKNARFATTLRNRAVREFKAVTRNSKEDRLRYFESKIRGNSDWFESVKQKAKERGVTVDEMVRKDAEYLWKKELEKGASN